MPTITFRLCDDDDEGHQQKKSSPPSSSNEDGKTSKTTTRKKKNSKKDPSPSQKPLLIKQEEDTDADDVVLVSESTRGGNNGTGATSTPAAITTAASHQNNSKKSAFMRRMEEFTKTAPATRTSENQQFIEANNTALPTANPPTSKRKRNVQEKTETSKKPRKESSKSPTVSLPQDEESFYMNCTDEELARWLKEKYRQKAKRISEQLHLQMKEELALLRNKRNLAKLLANDDISSFEKQQTQTKKQIEQKQDEPAPKISQTTTPPKQSQASSSEGTNSSSSQIEQKQAKPAPKTPQITTTTKQSQASTSAATNSSSSRPMINISTKRKSCPTCKSFCKAIFTSKSGCEHQYCEACVIVASFASNRQDDSNSNSEQMTSKKSTPSAVSLASTCTKSTAMQSGSTQGSISTLTIPVPSSCPICHILDCQPNKPPPVQNVVAVKPKRKNPYVPEWMQSPLEQQQQELGLERKSPPRNHMSPPPRNHMSPPPPVAGGLPMNSAASLIYPSTHHLASTASRTQHADTSKQDTNMIDRKLQAEIEKGEMLKYLLSQEKLRRMNAPPQQEQYPPSHPFNPYYGRF